MDCPLWTYVDYFQHSEGAYILCCVVVLMGHLMHCMQRYNKSRLYKLNPSSCRAVILLRVHAGTYRWGSFLLASFIRHLLYCERYGRKIGCFSGLARRSFYQDRIRRREQSETSQARQEKNSSELLL